MNAEHSLKDEVDEETPKFVQQLISRHPQTLTLQDGERRFAARLILRSIIRNPVMLDHLQYHPLVWVAKQIFSLKRWIQRGKKTDEAKALLGKQRVLQGDFIESIVTIDIDERVEEFSKMRFVFLTPAHGVANFILGSQPYYIKPSARKNTSSEPNSHKDSFVGMVLHPRLLLALYDEVGADEHLTASSEDVMRLNGLFVKYSSVIAMVSANDIDGCWYWEHGKVGSDEISKVEIKNIQNEEPSKGAN